MSATYDGLFGPDDVTWRVHADPVMWVAGLRALLLQATHPAAMAGVLTHSDFRADPWGRLMRTADYVGVVTFGSRGEAESYGAHVRAIHAKVRGVDPVTGMGYRADDPELLRWVHMCEVESFLTTYRRAGGRLTPAEVDRYYREQTRAAQLVGLRPADVPASRGEVADYFTAMRPVLAADERTRGVALFVVFPSMPLWVQVATPARVGWAGVASLAVALLPRWARRLYGLPGLPTTDLAATMQLRAVHAGLGLLPSRFREGPHLRAAKARLAA